MNLKEILNYRNKCIICQKDMVVKYYGANKLMANISDDGMTLSSKNKNGLNCSFKYDGTYTKNKLVKSNLTFIKKCLHCVNNEDYANLFSSNVNNLKLQECFYIFSIDGFDNEIYNIKLISENIRYRTDEEFWHINTNSQYSFLHYGKYKNSLNNILTLKLPTINMLNIKTPEQVINKIKLYSTFS